MWYDSARTTVHFKSYRVPSRCWRCWKKFESFAPYDFVDLLLFPCDRCGTVRVLETYGECNYSGAEDRYMDLHHPEVTHNEQKKYRKGFLKLFENYWTEPCSCGGRFRLYAPIRCPHCGAPEWRLLRGRNKIAESPPFPVLKFTVPPEYQHTLVRPPWKPRSG